MNAHTMFTAFNQSWPVYFILFNLLFCKITHACNFIFSLNFFINQIIDIFTTPFFFAIQRYKLIFKSVLFALSFSCVFITKTSALLHVSTLISTILYIRKKKIKFFNYIKCSILFVCFPLLKSLAHFIFLIHLFFLNYIKCSIVLPVSPNQNHSLIFCFLYFQMRCN